MAVIYRHRKAGTDDVFYIGIGITKQRAYRKTNRNKYWHNIVNKYDYEVDIIFEGISYSEACSGEKLLIKLYGRRDLKTGCLVNMTDGGENNAGKVVSDETRKKSSISHKGRKHSEEQKNKISISNTDKIRPYDTKKKKIILNLETGIFYLGLSEVSSVTNYTIKDLSRKLNGSRKNNTDFIYV
jgi:hypothetical protein